MKNIFKNIMVSVLLLVPALVSAQPQDGLGEIGGTATNIISFINNTLIPLVFAIALLVFIWGMFRFFILGAHKDDDRAAGKQLMIWATVGFVLMVSIFGIVNLVAGGLGFTNNSIDPIIPAGPTSNN